MQPTFHLILKSLYLMTSFQTSQVEGGQRKFIKIESKSYKNQRFDFQSYELAFAVRQTVYLKIIAFDANNDQQFQQTQIRDFLQNILHQSETQIKYVIRNVFRYDYNNDGVIEYDQLVNFCMEQHFGQLAIQRLHKKKLYKKGAQRLMNQQEFKETIKYALSFIEFNPTENDLKMAFQTIDNDKDGEISYEDYFRFLKQYFGTKSYAAGLVNKRSILEQIHNSRQKKGELNIVKRYSKYENLNNNPNANKGPQTNIPKVLPISNQKVTPPQNNTAQNTSQLPINMGGSNTNKKNPKIELTLVNKSKQHKNQIVLTANQQAIANKIARLVYTQLVVGLTEYDNDKDCMLSPDDIVFYLKTKLKFGENFATELYKKHNLVKNKLLSYNQIAKIILNEHIFNTFRTQHHESSKNLQLSQFCQLLQKVCSIVKNTPVVQKYESLYQSRSEKGAMTYGQVQNLCYFVFNNYASKK